MELCEAVAKKVLETVDAGLVRGVGEPVAGQMCVEAAVNFALGAPHGDSPSCVGYAVRRFKIGLNDSIHWKSNESRARGLRRIAVAQLGSNEIDQQEFVKLVVIGTVQKILPIVCRLYGHEQEAKDCENAKTLMAAESAAKAARIKLITFATANAAYDAATAAAYAAATAAYAAAYAANAAYAAATAAAYAANADAAAANADAAAADAAEDILIISAKIGEEALVKLGSRGVEWLPLCEKS